MAKDDGAACAVLFLNQKPDNVDLPQNTTLLDRIHPRLAGLLPINTLESADGCSGRIVPLGKSLISCVRGDCASAGASGRVDPGFMDRAAEGAILQQAQGKMAAPAGPEGPEAGDEDRTIAFQGEREVDAIP
jgi:hypothetical protein